MKISDLTIVQFNQLILQDVATHNKHVVLDPSTHEFSFQSGDVKNPQSEAMNVLSELNDVVRNIRDTKHLKDLYTIAVVLYHDYDNMIKGLNLSHKDRTLALANIQSLYDSIILRVEGQEEELFLERSHLKGSVILEEDEKSIQENINRHRNPTDYDIKVENYKGLTDFADKEILPGLIKKNQQTLDGLKEPQKTIFLTDLKRESRKLAYEQQLGDRVKKGFYNPDAIHFERDRVINPAAPKPLSNGIPMVFHSIDDVSFALHKEIDHFNAITNRHQRAYIKKDIDLILGLYVKAYPEKTLNQRYLLARDVMRTIVYQEYFDKSAFPGSDHGSKHVHHNIENSIGFFNSMKENKDFTDKDKFLVYLGHAYHDIGYTVGLAGLSFDCSKDHPFLGAAFLDSMKDKMIELLDEEGFTMVRDSVLFHAIATPDFSPEKNITSTGIHRNLDLSILTSADAAAVTYDRKAQEFWEQASSITVLAKLRMFTTMFPRYAGILGNPKIIVDEWAGLDKNNPKDVLAHDLFQEIRAELLKRAEKYSKNMKLPPQRKELFEKAIMNQFSAFTAGMTLGQFGGVLSNVELVEMKNRIEGDPKYIAKFTMGVSIVYRLLADLYGDDQAQKALQKLMEEFGGDIKKISEKVNEISEGKTKSFEGQLGNAEWIIEKHDAVPEKNVHLADMQKELNKAMSKLEVVHEAQLLPEKKRAELLKDLDEWKLNPNNFEQFLQSKIVPKLEVSTKPEKVETIIKQFNGLNAKKMDEVHQNYLKVEKDYRSAFDPVQKLLPDNDKEIKQLMKDLDKSRKSGFVKNEKDINEKFEAFVKKVGGDENLKLVLNETKKHLLERSAEYVKAESDFSQVVSDDFVLTLMSDIEIKFMGGKLKLSRNVIQGH